MERKKKKKMKIKKRTIKNKNTRVSHYANPKSIPKSPASLIYLLVPTLSVSKFTNTLNSIVNTDGSYSDPALCHGIFSSACCVVMFLVVCPVCGLFLFLFNVNIILLDTLIFFFLWGNGGVGTHAVNSH